jgi:hypothetical protein
MKHLKTYQQLNELHQDTYKSAWEKVAKMDQDRIDSFLDTYRKSHGYLHPAISNNHTEREAKIVYELSKVLKEQGTDVYRVFIDGGDLDRSELDTYSINYQDFWLVASMEDVETALNKMLYEEYIFDHGYEEGDAEREMINIVENDTANIMNNPDEIARKFNTQDHLLFNVDSKPYIALFIE